MQAARMSVLLYVIMSVVPVCGIIKVCIEPRARAHLPMQERLWRAICGFNCSCLCCVKSSASKDVSGRDDRLDRVGNGD
jgi:hypothetical protein